MLIRGIRCLQLTEQCSRNYLTLTRFSSAYKSPLSLDKLYPASSGNAKPGTKDVSSEFSGQIPMNELTKTYSCSSGPGGQNVNKVATKVDLRFHVESASWLSPGVKAKVLEKYGSELTKDGWMVVKSDRTRSQTLNQADALEKLRTAIRSALAAPKPKFTAEEEERIRKGKLKAARERLHYKRIRSDVKAQRSGRDQML
eukprot:TRINITY_DN3798_c0_g1_i1.p1 TRINITY_DN3798_c0_g1~~TRINITY_DN3798_c0_g1_i1.p1  ORF type:complete len:199 (-),score=22.05 TRINITY_DN3798_c0_g1_i1:35-631(-)